jgi:hypothetical protein
MRRKETSNGGLAVNVVECQDLGPKPVFPWQSPLVDRAARFTA